jgi:hypothetical protein
MENKIVIYPMQGINNLKFGVKQEDVKRILGEPDDIENMEEEGEFSSLIWQYWDMGLTIFFDELDNSIFASAEVEDPDAIVFGQRIFDLSEKEAVALFKENGYTELDVEDHDWGERRISFDDAMVDLYYEKGRLNCVNLSTDITTADITPLILPN